MYPANKQTDGNKQTQKAVINRTVTKWRGLSTHRRVRSYLLQRSSNLLLIIVPFKKQHRCTYHGNVSVKCRGVVRRPEAVQRRGRRPTENSATKTQMPRKVHAPFVVSTKLKSAAFARCDSCVPLRTQQFGSFVSYVSDETETGEGGRLHCSSRVQVLARSVGLSRDCCIVGVATSELQQLRSTVNSTLNARRSRSLAASAAVAPLPTYTSRQNDSAIRCPSPTPRLSPSRD